MDWYIAVLKKYAVFTGRSRRKELWMFFLCHSFIIIFLFPIDAMSNEFFTLDLPIFITIYVLATLLPNLGVQVRRLHDIGITGWLILIGLIPYVGVLVLLIAYMTDSEPGENKFGPNPKGVLKEDEKVVT
jgi:uncharacterized membrane protein YhaH (DUF805 family)